MGTKARPFYRVVVAKSTAARDGAFVEIIGTYNPLTKPHAVKIKNDRAMHWLLEGAQPTETVAYLFKQAGVLDEFLSQRPNSKRSFKFLDKRTASSTKKTVVDAVAVAEPAKAAPAPVPAVEEIVAVVETPAAVEEVVAVTEAPAVVEVVVAAEAPAPVAEVVAVAEAATSPAETPAEEKA